MDQTAPNLTTGWPWRMAALALVALAGCRAVSTGRNMDGVRYFQEGQYPVALQRFDSALTIDSRNADAYYNKAAVFHRMGTQARDQSQLTQAESLYRQALDINPNHVDAHRGLAVLLTETGRVDQAFQLLKTWAVTSPQNAEARVELARLYEEYGDPKSAVLYLNEALTISGNNWRALAALGRLREQEGDYKQALENYQRSLTYNRFQPQIEQRVAELRTRVSPTTAAAAAPAPGTSQSAAGPRPFLRY
ncbi:MAG: tetratricopeptide repeat protein [Pirellulaceae bacterium]|nr:tetratricopeptide repeat protein [Pirellulaceae bacterium]